MLLSSEGEGGGAVLSSRKSRFRSAGHGEGIGRQNEGGGESLTGREEGRARASGRAQYSRGRGVQCPGVGVETG